MGGNKGKRKITLIFFKTPPPHPFLVWLKIKLLVLKVELRKRFYFPLTNWVLIRERTYKTEIKPEEV